MKNEEQKTSALDIIFYLLVIVIVFMLFVVLIEYCGFFSIVDNGIDLLKAIFISLIFIIPILFSIYKYRYFGSEEFLSIKKRLEPQTNECNSLNSYLESLKKCFINVKPTDVGDANYTDNSFWNYKKPYLCYLNKRHHVYNCSLSVCKSAQLQPFKYFCKYFNVPTNLETLSVFEELLNNFSAVEEGKKILRKDINIALDSVSEEVPSIIKTFCNKELVKKLGFNDVNVEKSYFPTYTFEYISAGGNSCIDCDIIFNVSNLNRFVKYLSDLISLKSSIPAQRALMTSKLREKIKIRDNYTCQICGISIKDEPNLLLEIDHIIPLSKNGMTTEDNLQTLCWKCNRAKSNKILVSKDS